MAGVIEIVFSLLLPFVVTLSVEASTNPDLSTGTLALLSNYVVISGISLVIALLAGIRNFYSWQENWQLYATISTSLRDTLTEWEMEIQRGLDGNNPEGRNFAFEATQDVASRIRNILDHEHQTFFGSVSLPSSK